MTTMSVISICNENAQLQTSTSSSNMIGTEKENPDKVAKRYSYQCLNCTNIVHYDIATARNPINEDTAYNLMNVNPIVLPVADHPENYNHSSLHYQISNPISKKIMAISYPLVIEIPDRSNVLVTKINHDNIVKLEIDFEL